MYVQMVSRGHKMQLLVNRINNKTTAPHILCNKFNLVILTFFHILVHLIGVTAELTCHQCLGVNCLRTSYESTQKCGNDLDICANVFDGQSLLAQGCWEQLPETLRNKCDSGEHTQDSKELSNCFKCNGNLCNSLSSNSFDCIQCDSESNYNCRTNPLSLEPSRCGISRTPNEYCFVRQERERIIRGCSNTLEAQMSCLNSDDCMICQPSELRGCNNIEITVVNSGLDEEHTGDGESETNSGSSDERTCHLCSGLNCLRTNYEATQKCLNDLDVCVTVYEGQTVLAQDCWEQLSEEERNKCDNGTQCLKCNANLCNNLASNSFECLQCDSNSDENCRINALSLTPSRCYIARTPNEYCFVKQKGDRVIRGCSYTLEEQMSCLSSENCEICQPSELSGCNNINVVRDNNGSGGDSDGDKGNGGSSTGSVGGGSEYGGTNEGNAEDSASDSGESSGDGQLGGNTDHGGSDSGGGSEYGSNGSNICILNTFIVINVIIAFFITK